MSDALRSALSAAQGLAWADPHLRAHEGRAARMVLESARAAVATVVGDPDAVVTFVPGRDAALALAATAVGAEGPLVVGAADRRSVLRAARARVPATETVTVPVDTLGRVNTDIFLGALRNAAAACVQVGNPEVGTTQPVAELHRGCVDLGIPLMVDATMAAGRTPLPINWDLLVLDARSWGGGNDVGIVVRRATTHWRPSSDNPPSDGLGVAHCAAAALTLETAAAGAGELDRQQRHLTEHLRTGLGHLPEVAVHGDAIDRLPHIVGFSALYIDAEALLLELDRRGISVASGSACVVDDDRPSHVLTAMGALTSGNVRVTLPLEATAECVERLLEDLPPVLHRMRAEAGL